MAREQAPLGQGASPHELFRKTFIDFNHALDDRELSTIIRNALLDPISPEADEEAFISLCTYVNWNKIQSYSPIWLDPRKYVSELFKLSSPKLWKGLLDHANEKEPNISNRLRQAFIDSNSHDFIIYDLDTAETLTQQNYRFYGLATVYLGLAAVYGPRLVRCTKAKIDERRFQDITQPIFQAGQRVGSGYLFPPVDNDELICRLRNIFSPDEENGSSGYQALLQTKAFGNRTKQNGHEAPICPAVRLTRELFKDYRALLQTQTYQNHLKNSVVSDRTNH